MSDRSGSTETAARGGETDALQWWSNHTGVPVGFLKQLPLRADGDGISFLFTGAIAKRRRLGLSKRITWVPKDVDKPNLWPVPQQRLPSEVWFLEGESDCTVARYVGLEGFALTKGVSGTLDLEEVRDLVEKGMEQPVLCLDADKAGAQNLPRHLDAFRAAGLTPLVCNLRSLGLGKDENDVRDVWLRDPSDRAAFRQLVESVVESATEPGTIDMPVPGSANRMVWAEDLRTEGVVELDYLPFLGQFGYIVRDWTTLIAASPKVGKTELMARLCHEWASEQILYVTEEPRNIWAARLNRLPTGWSHVRMYFGLGVDGSELLQQISTARADVVVIDTVRNLLGLWDETDNSEVARALTPYISACRNTGKTLLLVHHVRKGGGDNGEGITGGHAFLGIVDAALEVLRDSALGETRRRVRGWSRVCNPKEVMYEFDAGGIRLLGSPDTLKLENVKSSLLDLLDQDWKTVGELLERMEEPRPSRRQVRSALSELFHSRQVERDPPEDRRGATYTYKLSGEDLS